MRRASAWLLCALLCACGDDDNTFDAGLDAARDAVVDANQVDADADAHVGDADFDASRDASDVDASDAAIVDPGYATKLSATGLYEDIATDRIASDVMAFEPAYFLWSDGATKRRFLYLPPNTQIDTSDMDHWVFPLGTKVWKEFTRGAVRVETRLLEKTERGWLMLAYVWNDENAEANVTLLPVENARGTDHDVPSRGECLECHGGQPDRVLGVSAIQLSHDKPGLTLTQLIDDERLTDPPSAPFVLPGDALDQATLGMLHANCGNCHTPGTVAFERAAGMELWLSVDSLSSVEATNTFRTTVGVDLVWFERPGFTKRIEPGEPMQSALWFRMDSRGDETQMPPIASKDIDMTGVDRLFDWIDRLN